MNIDTEKAFATIRDQFDAAERQMFSINLTKEAAVRFTYELRSFVEGEQRRNVDPTMIVAGVLAKLKAVTPHGSTNTIDQ